MLIHTVMILRHFSLYPKYVDTYYLCAVLILKMYASFKKKKESSQHNLAPKLNAYSRSGVLLWTREQLGWGWVVQNPAPHPRPFFPPTAPQAPLGNPKSSEEYRLKTSLLTYHWARVQRHGRRETPSQVEVEINTGPSVLQLKPVSVSCKT